MLGAGVIGDLAFAKERAEHRADLCLGYRYTGILCRPANTLAEPFRLGDNAIQHTRLAYLFQRHQPCCHRQRIAGQGPGLIHRSCWSDGLHDLTLSGIGTDR